MSTPQRMWSRRLRPLAACVLALVAVGCAGEGASDRPTFTVTDSAGVRISVSAAPAWGEGDAWTLASEPSLRIGEVEGEPPYLFSQVAGALRLPDGGVVVGDGRSRELRFFDASGAFRFSAGGLGDGPGELRMLQAISWCGSNTLHAFDIRRRPHLFTPDGQWVSALPEMRSPIGAPPMELSCGAGGRFVALDLDLSVPGPMQPGDYHRSMTPVRLHGEDGAVLADLGTHPGFEYGGSERGERPHPFGRRIVHALDDRHVYLGTGDAHEIALFSHEGALDRIYRWEGGSLDYTDADFDRYWEPRLAAASPERRPDVAREQQEWTRPLAWPAYQSLGLDPDGNLWIERANRDAAYYPPSGEWTVLGPDGRLLGRVRTPPDFRVTEIGADFVLGVARDELGVERVELYRLLKPAAEP